MISSCALFVPVKEGHRSQQVDPLDEAIDHFAFALWRVKIAQAKSGTPSKIGMT